MESNSSPRELIAVAQPEAGLRVTPEGLKSRTGDRDLQQLVSILSEGQAELEPLFGVPEDVLEERMSEKPELFSSPALRLSLYYRVVAPDDRLESLVEQLRESKLLNAVYIKPGADLARFYVELEQRLDIVATPGMCDFRDDQEYLASGENGIDAHYAWQIKGGKGDGVNLIDIEGAWRFSHSDLQLNHHGLLGGTPFSDQRWEDHGTAVLGVIGADENDFGTTGICPNALLGAVSIFGWPKMDKPPTWGTGAAILSAADLLTPGDIIVVELHFAGPPDFDAGQERGHIPAEWWADCMAAINYATSRDLIVVAAAGNGSSDLKSDIYNINPSSPNGPFPTGWHNPLLRNPIDTGSIFVGAGAPRRLVHDSDHGPARSRLPTSNYGPMVDAQAWGAEVTTCGYDVLICGNDRDSYYTDRFNGTSSATAIVAGAIACLQGIRKAANKPPLTSKQVRQILQETGSPQTDFPGSLPRPATERIGNLPNLKQMIEKMSQY